jgi:hypothetical protein
MSTKSAVAVPLRGVGSFFAMTLDTILLIPQRPFAFREFVVQACIPHSKCENACAAACRSVYGVSDNACLQPVFVLMCLRRACG